MSIARTPTTSPWTASCFSKDHARLIIYPAAKNPGGSYTVPEGTTEIANKAFAEAGIVTVTLPTSLRTIGDEAFRLSALTALTLPEGFDTVGTCAFCLAASLDTIDLGGTVTIKGSAFEGVGAKNGVNFRSDLNKLTTIGDFGFSRTGMKAVTLPDSVTTVGEQAFSDSTGIT